MTTPILNLEHYSNLTNEVVTNLYLYGTCPKYSDDVQ